MRWIVVAVLALAGCSSEAANLERQYDIVAKDRDNQAICDAARKVAEAYLKAGNEARYAETKNRADINCMTASFEPYNTQGLAMSGDDPDNLTALVEPDNMEALPDNTTG